MHANTSLMFALAGLGLATLPNAKATPITFTGTGNNGTHPVSASAVFDTPTPGTLTISLHNTYSTEIHIGGADILTGLLFSTGDTDLTPISATLGSSSALILLTPGDSTDLSANWGFVPTGAHVGPGPSTGISQAVTASGLITGGGIFNMVNENQQSSGSFLHGAGYGIVGNSLDSTGGGGLRPLVADTIDFTFTFDGALGPISDVYFVYGTAPGEGLYIDPPPAIPDAANTMALLFAPALALIALSRRRRT